jgi:hypothetical protein
MLQSLYFPVFPIAHYAESNVTFSLLSCIYAISWQRVPLKTMTLVQRTRFISWGHSMALNAESDQTA